MQRTTITHPETLTSTMNDDHLSDHEWRLKQAAEGKAIYVPGKPVEQVKAEREAAAAAAARKQPITLDLSAAELEALDTALPDLVDTVRDVGRVFTFLADQPDPDQLGLMAIMRLSALAMRGLEDRELPALETLETALRRTTAEQAKATLKGGRK